MKKHLLKLSFFASLPLVSLAAISCSNNPNIPPVDYEMINVETNGLAFNSKGEITKFYNFGGSTDINLVIPEYLVNNRILTSEYYGYKQRITSIGMAVFSANKYSSDALGNPYAQYINSVTMPNSIETIDAEAFYGTQLEEVNIPDSVIDIGSGAFENCISLVNIKLSKNTKYVGSRAFAGTAITKIDFPNTLLEIEFRAFDGAQLSGELFIPDSVKTIGNYAFDGTKITRVSIPKTCEYKQDSFPSGCTITRRP